VQPVTSPSRFSIIIVRTIGQVLKVERKNVFSFSIFGLELFLIHVDGRRELLSSLLEDRCFVVSGVGCLRSHWLVVAPCTWTIAEGFDIFTNR